MSHWFKFYGQDWMTDPKIMLLTPVEKAAFVVLLCLASQTDDGRIKFFTEGRLKVMTGAEPNGDDWDALDGVLDKFASLNLIEVDEDNGGEILVVNFAKRQATNLTNAERQQKLRDKRNATSNGSNARIEKNSIEQKRKDEAFDIFWKAYPRKTSKKNARRSQEREIRLRRISPHIPPQERH